MTTASEDRTGHERLPWRRDEVIGWGIAFVTAFGVCIVASAGPTWPELRVLLNVAGPGVDISALAAGDCVRDMTPESEELAPDAVEVVGCSKPHAEEVYATFSLPKSKRYPGDERVDALAQSGCDQRYEAYVGLPVDTDFDTYITYPPSDDWPDDRVVVCTVAGAEGLTTGSLRNYGH